MRTSFFGLLILTSSAFAQVVVPKGGTMKFGESLAAIEKRTGETAFELDEGRPGADKRVSLGNCLLDFDENLFWRVTYGRYTVLPVPLAAFPETWRNLPALDGLNLHAAMSREEFATYLARWQEQAARAGKQLDVDYWIRRREDSTGTRVVITFAPRRRYYRRDEMAGDTWAFNFIGETDRKYNPNVVLGALTEVAATCDTYSTRYRDPTGKGPAVVEPAPADAPPGPTLVDGTHLYFGQTQEDAERRLGQTAVDARSARRDVEKEIGLTTLVVGLDRGKVARFRFTGGNALPGVFRDDWKNLSPIGEFRARVQMSGEEFATYLTAWENRAVAAGHERGRDFVVQEVAQGQSKAVRISMPPAKGERESPRPDEWLAVLARVRDSEWRLLAFEVLSGEFSTRPLPGRDRRLDEVRRAGEKLPLPEIELPKPGLPTLP